jgi:hypothetical protein
MKKMLANNPDSLINFGQSDLRLLKESFGQDLQSVKDIEQLQE